MPHGHADRRARRRVVDGVLDQVQRQPVQLVACALDDRRRRSTSTSSSWSSASACGLADRVERDLAEVERPRWCAPARCPSARAAAGRRRAGACGAPSAARRRRPHAARRAARRCSSSRFASTLVSGVRSSCEASATNSRWRLQRALGLEARALERAEHLLERLRQLGDLVVAVRLGDGERGVAGPRDLARGGRDVGHRAQRAARQREPAEQREQRAAEDAEGQEQAHAARPSG